MLPNGEKKIFFISTPVMCAFTVKNFKLPIVWGYGISGVVKYPVKTNLGDIWKTKPI